MANKFLSILIIEDDPYFRLGLKSHLKDLGLIDEATSENEAIEKMSSNFYDLVLIDMQLESETSGINLIKFAGLKKIHSIVLSSVTDDDITELAYSNGCNHFLSKIKYKEQIETYIHKYMQSLKTDSFEDFITKKYITTDSDLILAIKNLTEINLKDKSIFITGETGVGKSLIGKLLHQFTYKSDAPFVHLNCTEIPENLIESELFGHKKGAFTGALTDKKGKLETASGGVLFLDEIATMPMIMQQKLLKAIDEKTFYPLGSNTPVTINFTLITATCEDVFEKISKGEFRRDLFYRIAGLNLDIKPLRSRTHDVKALINHFVKSSPRRFVIKDDAMDALLSYPWPGNVRELKKMIDLLSLSSKGIITAKDLPSQLGLHDNALSDNGLLTLSQKEMILTEGLKNFINRIEQEITQEVLVKNHGKITQSIKDLRISTSSFYRIFDNLKV